MTYNGSSLRSLLTLSVRVLKAKAFVKDEFDIAERDEVKIDVLIYKEAYWSEIGEARVKAWLWSRLPTWLEEQPQVRARVQRARVTSDISVAANVRAISNVTIVAVV